MAKYVMALDSGTTSNRCILFDENGRIRSVAQKEFIQHFPKPGWVEHDAGEIWSTQLSVAREAMNQIEATAEDIAAIGITNQRETTIVWDKNTGQPVYHAIVWQCRRTSEYCDSLKAKGLEVGTSLVDDTKLDYCKEMIEKAEKLGKKLLLPVDTTIAKAFPSPIDAEIEVSVVKADAIPADMMGLDIGAETAALYADAVKTAKTVVWNGPMGVFENPILAKGTIAVAKALAETDATTIIGGGDSAAAVNQLGFGDKMSHISTGGGASLEFLEGKDLPGVVAADDK